MFRHVPSGLDLMLAVSVGLTWEPSGALCPIIAIKRTRFEYMPHYENAEYRYVLHGQTPAETLCCGRKIVDIVNSR